VTRPFSVLLRERVLIAPDGEFLPITNMFDDCGEDTDDVCLAFRVVAGPRQDGNWYVADTTDDERERASKVN